LVFFTLSVEKERITLTLNFAVNAVELTIPMMRSLKTLLICLCFLVPFCGFGLPYFYLNEVSQGIQDSQEYAEFVIAGGCPTATLSTLDMRRLIIDDNEGVYQVGTNVSTGALRFADISFWQSVPEGTIIVIYNEADRNPAIPPDDMSLSDGNGRLILPANSILLEGLGTSPTSTNASYYGLWVAGAGQWSYVSMENDGDTFKAQLPYAADLYFSTVSWGSNTAAPLMTIGQYFSGSAAGLVFYVDTHVALGGWLSGPATTSQTPGEPNSPSNYHWIYQSILNSPLDVVLTSAPESCFNACDATVHAQTSGGSIPYSYTWNVPSQGAVLHNRCPGTYTVIVTDADGCRTSSEIIVEPVEELQASISQTGETCPGECDGTVSLTVTGGTGAFSVTWSDGSSGLDLTDLCPDDYSATVKDSAGCTVEVVTTIVTAPPLTNSIFTAAGPFQTGHPPVQLENSIPGGIYTTSDCSGCLTPSGIFDPSAVGEGIYEICYTRTIGNCSAVRCQHITVMPCTPEQTSASVYICEGDSVIIFGNWQAAPGIFSQTFTGSNCDSIHQITLRYYNTPNIYLSLSLCEDDSLLVFGNWVDSAGVFSQQMQSESGCSYTKQVTVTAVFCSEEAYIYIPNAFTPDGDLVNDEFRIEILGAILEEGYIYDRWGEIVARFDENNLTWNGNNIQGKTVPDGVYIYVVKYLPVNGVRGQYVGHVTLLR
jgi:gliding motility-associated-like protein